MLLAAPATIRIEGVAKARYLLILFAQTAHRRKSEAATLVADVSAGFERLFAERECVPVVGDAWLAPASLIKGRIAMAKGQQRSNREAKKPKKDKPKIAPATQAPFGLTPKSAGAKDDRGKKK